MADYRVIRRKITGNEYFGSHTYDRYGYHYIAQRKTWLGWVNIGRLQGSGYPYRIKYICDTQSDAEQLIKIYVSKLLEEAPDKSVDVVAEFDYTGPTKIDRFLERIDYGRT